MIDVNDIYNNSIIWDNSVLWAQSCKDRQESLDEVIKANTTVVSIKINAAQANFISNLREIAKEREKYKKSDKFILARDIEDVYRAKAENKTAITFSLCDTAIIESVTEDIETFCELGVTHVNIAAQRNYVGDCWFEDTDAGLSMFGKEFVKLVNSKSIYLDGSLAGYKTTMEAMQLSTKPFIFSHVNPYGVCKNIRNIKDDQIKFCAETGGVIGITFLGGYMGSPNPNAELAFRNIDYICELVGPEHVGFGSNFSTNAQELWNSMISIKKENEIYEGSSFYHRNIVDVISIMVKHGYTELQIKMILGKNWLRLYKNR